MTIHKEGYKIILGTLVTMGAIVAALILSFDNASWLYYTVFPVLAIFLYLVIQFFRLPHRKNISAPDQLVAPCDGKVVVIEEVDEPEYYKTKRLQVSIFMSPLNVHANWTPCDGEVKYAKYHSGLYLVAWHPKSSTENERTTIVIEQTPAKSVLIRQIAGAVARRIVFYVKPGDKLSKNDEVGFIKFGSRVDIFLPLDAKVHVKIDDITKGNETVIASW
jgi:phosphatidylserine decarboxylase